MTDQNSPQFTQTSAPDVAPGVEVPPDVDFPPDNEPLDPTDDASAVVADPTPGGD